MGDLFNSFVNHEETEEIAKELGGACSDGVHWWRPGWQDLMLGPACAKCNRRFCAILLDGGNWQCEHADCGAVWHVCGDGNVVFNSNVGPAFCPKCSDASREKVSCKTGGAPRHKCSTCQFSRIHDGMWGIQYST